MPISALRIRTLFRYNRNGQDPELACAFGHDSGRTRAGAAAHTCGNERHVRSLERFGDHFAALVRSFATDFRVRARAEALCQLFADLYLRGRLCQA
jgi:hypothetical protein